MAISSRYTGWGISPNNYSARNAVRAVHTLDLLVGRFRAGESYPGALSMPSMAGRWGPLAQPDGARILLSPRKGIMKMRAKVIALGFALACVASSSYFAQQETTAYDVSLGDVARHLRAQRPKNQKSARVITNDDLTSLIDALGGLGSGSQGVSSGDSVESFTVVQAKPAASPSKEGASVPTEGAGQGMDSLGFVQTADGKIQTVVADGNTVRLVPQTPTEAMAKVAPPAVAQTSAPLAQLSSVPATEVVSARGAEPANSVAGKMRVVASPPSLIRPASYQASPPILGPASGSALGQTGHGLTGVASGPIGVTPSLAASRVERQPAATTDIPVQLPVSIKPLGYVVTANGEFAAILTHDDEIYIVRQGDTFAGRYRAVSVTAEAVEAVEEPPVQVLPFTAPPNFPGWLSAAAGRGPSQISNEDCYGCNLNELGSRDRNVPTDASMEVASRFYRNREAERSRFRSLRWPWRVFSRGSRRPVVTADSHAAVVFQTLGYVQTGNGDWQAIVADGADVYLVRQGQLFGDRYRATSADSALVVAERVPPGKDAGESPAQAESSSDHASKGLYGYLHYPLQEWMNAQASRKADSSAGSALTDLGLSLLNSSLTGMDF